MDFLVIIKNETLYNAYQDYMVKVDTDVIATTQVVNNTYYYIKKDGIIYTNKGSYYTADVPKKIRNVGTSVAMVYDNNTIIPILNYSIVVNDGNIVYVDETHYFTHNNRKLTMINYHTNKRTILYANHFIIHGRYYYLGVLSKRIYTIQFGELNHGLKKISESHMMVNFRETYRSKYFISGSDMYVYNYLTSKIDYLCSIKNCKYYQEDGKLNLKSFGNHYIECLVNDKFQMMKFN